MAESCTDRLQQAQDERKGEEKEAGTTREREREYVDLYVLEKQIKTYQIQIIHCIISILLNFPPPSVTKATKNPAKHQTASTINLVN